MNIICKECNGNSFDNVNGAWWCEDCGLESIQHGQDYDTSPPFVEPSVGEDSNDDYLEFVDYTDEESSDESTDDKSTDDESIDNESMAEKKINDVR